MGHSTALYRDDYVSIHLEREGKLVRVIRSSKAYPDIAAMEHSYGQLIDVALSLRRKDLGLLTDQRLAPGRNDPAFEQAVARLRNQLYPLFRKRAVLVQSMVGKLQLTRLSKADGLARLVSQDEAEILRYLEV